MKIIQSLLTIIILGIVMHAGATDRYWGNTGTDFNDGASWVGGTAPNTGDRGYFAETPTMQPYLSESKSVFGIFFTPRLGTNATAATSAYGGYVLSGAPGTVLTLTASAYNHSGVYMIDQCTTGTNKIEVGIGFPDETTIKERYINLVSGVMEISGPITGNSNNVLRVGGSAAGLEFILSGDNTGFTGGFTRAGSFPIYIRNIKSVSKLTRLEFLVHGGNAAAANRFVNQTGGPLVFENNPNLYLSGGDGVILESDYPIDFGTGTVYFSDSNAGRNCPLTINAPLVKIGGPTVQISSNNGYLKRGVGTLEVSGPSSYLGNTTVGNGVFLARHPQAVSPNSALLLARSGATDPGGILGLGYGNFTNTLGTGVGQFYTLNSGGYYSIGGWAAYGADRTVNIGNDFRPMTNSLPFFGSIILGAPDSDATVTFQNPLLLDDCTLYSYNGSAEVDGRISGIMTNYTKTSSTLAKRGDGTLELTAANTILGSFNVFEGELRLSGQILNNCFVKTNGVLSGAGKFGGNEVTIEAGGTLAIANRLGTSEITGLLRFNSGARLNIELDGSNATGVRLTGISKKYSNDGLVFCHLSASSSDVNVGNLVILDWTTATTPNVDSLDATKFSIANEDEFTGTFTKQGTTLVLHYRNLAIKPTTIIVR